ncbi:hypothetical protein [Fimbriiglobus ruber]|uniref:Lipoprotein n=1 Tax=Fimbriiglobus ruber TaxID=1908690 RepID=A0A225DDW6_9BACT|nr:hypothetical protein [Fimbriiglobus ruber]OWK39183.1 hypothetical protein FRUB_06265 [Fimbriiglobus ruber]
MKRVLVLAAALAVSAVGCMNARYVQKGSDEGTVGIPRNSDEWPGYNRTSALKLIEDHVGSSYEILTEHEVVLNQKSLDQQKAVSQAAFNPNNPIMPSGQLTNTNPQSDQATEWQIQYRKKPVAGDPAKGIAGAQPPAGTSQVGFQQPVDGANVPAPSMLPSGSPAALTAAGAGFPPPGAVRGQ